MYLFYLYQNLPSQSSLESSEEIASSSWLDCFKVSADCNWLIFQGRDEIGSRGNGEILQRFRLAGTYFEYDDKGVSNIRKAILDDLKSKDQRIVTENDKIDDVRIVSILRDRVVIRDASGESELWLSFSAKDDGSGTNDVATSVDSKDKGEDKAGYDRFGGKRVGDNRWVFDRQMLLSYYQELMDQPERLVQVFDSLNPIYDENRRITGYELKIEGEAEFFASVGLKQGDRVRTVNSTPMRSRRLAENFIRDFVENRASAFVFGVEREAGREEKLIYQVR